MSGVQHVLSASASLPAPPERVYRLIADYRDCHPRILPKHFSSLTVEKGGVGAGTVIRFQMRLLAKTQVYRARHYVTGTRTCSGRDVFGTK